MPRPAAPALRDRALQDRALRNQAIGTTAVAALPQPGLLQGGSALPAWIAPPGGIAFALVAFLLLAGQDATIKLLSASLALPLILAVRSVAILGVCFTLGGRRPFRAVWRSPVRWLLVGRGLIGLGAWTAYFTAARSLPLGQVAAFQFLAPLMVVLAAGWMLGEASSLRHRLLVLLGTVGALISGGSLGFSLQPALLLAATAAVLWAYAMLLTRRIARTEGALVQLVSTHLLFIAVMGPLALLSPVPPAAADLPLLMLVALLGGAGQLALYSAARSLPAPIMAPLEYTSLLWNFTFGYMIWRNTPGPAIVVGAMLIAVSCAGLLHGRWISNRAASR
ncbi:MAG: EamA-like transporter family protein [Belnapia sp.]|nr:EamA-like transporter family protein [Belnapia sp.]